TPGRRSNAWSMPRAVGRSAGPRRISIACLISPLLVFQTSLEARPGDGATGAVGAGGQRACQWAAAAPLRPWPWLAQAQLSAASRPFPPTARPQPPIGRGPAVPAAQRAAGPATRRAAQVARILRPGSAVGTAA